MEAQEMPARQCGSCTLCCKVLGVAGLDKPAGVWCRHCRPSQGCAIYETRPQECRTFACLWLANPNFPDELKPEHSKLVFVLEAEGNRIIAYCDPGRPLAWKEAANYRMLKSMAVRSAETGRQVVVALREHYTAILPDRDVPLGLVKPGQRIVYRETAAGVGRRLEPVVE
ncbi:MAG: hypothetical protein JO137_14025 [Hyphomicrobiales bacterium]|nr:hypothetical protein [Hyphomicrobiales bacterium]